MKNFCVLCVVLVVVSFLASSMADAQVKLGARGGLNLASASISPDLTGPGVSSSTRTGFLFGGIAEVGISSPLFIQIEPQYVQRGKKYEVSQSGMNATLTLKVDCIEVPVLLKAKFSAGGVAPFVFFGPSISFRMSAKQEMEAPAPIGGSTEDIKDEISSTSFGLDFGGGIELPVAPTLALLIDGRYGLGLSDIIKDGDVTGKYRDIKIGVGLLFGL